MCSLASECDGTSNVSQWLTVFRFRCFRKTHPEHKLLLSINWRCINSLHPEEESTWSYGLLEIYGGLPTYKWNVSSTADMNKFRDKAYRYNDWLFGVLKCALTEKLRLDPPYFPDDSWKRYLTHRVRRLIAGEFTGSVQSRGFTLPLVIPMALEIFLGELNCRYEEIQENALSEILKPIHDPSRYKPKTARLPSPQDTWDESGNLRFWLKSNKSMWAGQHRALDEVTELLLMLFNWFTRDESWQLPRHRPTYRTDDPQCIWYIADFFRRRLILPKASSALQKGQNLSQRESRLFRAWVLTRPSQPAILDRDHSDGDIERIKNELDNEDAIEEGLFWQDGDEGTWDNEDGVPSWRDSDDIFGLAGLSIWVRHTALAELMRRLYQGPAVDLSRGWYDVSISWKGGCHRSETFFCPYGLDKRFR